MQVKPQSQMPGAITSFHYCCVPQLNIWYKSQNITSHHNCYVHPLIFKTFQNFSCVVVNLHCQTRIQVLTWDLDSKRNGYIVLCRTCSHRTDSIWIPIPIWTQIPNRGCTHFLTDTRSRIGIRVRVRQCKKATGGKLWLVN